MKRKLLSGVLALAMILSTFLTNTAFVAAAGENEAKINDTEYLTLTEAIAAAAEGDTVTVLKDVAVDSTITVSKSITLTAETPVTIKRGDAYRAAMFTTTAGTLTLSGDLTLEGNTTAYGSIFLSTGTSTLVMNEGVTLKNNQHSNSTYGGAITLNGSAAFVMNGGTIENCGVSNTGTSGGVYNSGGGGAVRLMASSSSAPSATINGGTISDCFGYYGGAFFIGNYGYAPDIDLTINGGVIRHCLAATSPAATKRGSGGAIFASVKKGWANITVNGGEITDCVAGNYGTLGMSQKASYFNVKYNVFGGYIHDNFVGNGTNNSPSSFYGNGIYLYRPVNGEALLTIGGDAVIDDEIFVNNYTGNCFNIREDFTGRAAVFPQGMALTPVTSNGKLVAKAVGMDGALTVASKKAARGLYLYRHYLSESSAGDRVVNTDYSIVPDPANENQYILGDYVAPVEYTVTYTDGVEDEELFADQSYKAYEGDNTPAFEGEPTREGYAFAGWDPDFSETVAGNVTYTAKWSAQPEKPGITNSTNELFTVQCTTKHEHSWLCNWFGSHVVYNKDMAFDAERGVWTATAYFNINAVLNTTTIRNDFFGGRTHYSDVARPVVRLYWDPDATGLNSAKKEVTGLWLPDGEQVLDVYCWEKPSAPSDTTIQKLGSSKWIWMRDCNNTKQFLRAAPLAGTYEVGVPYEKDGAYYCELTVTDFDPYLEKFNAQFVDQIYAVCEEHTTATFTYLLKYTGSTTDYKQDGTGWTLDASGYASNSEYLNGKTLWVAGARTVTYTDGVEDEEIFEDQVYNTTVGSTTPSWNGEDPTREGYSFLRWDPEIADTVDENAVYTALWKANDYIVIFDANGGESLEGYTKRVTYDAPYGALMTPSREGHTFAGWYDENGDLVTSTTIYKFAKNTKLTARWTINTFDVTFVDENGETVDTITVDWNTVLTEDICPAVPEKEGHNGAWDLPANGVIKDIVVKPVYTIKQFTVTFVDENGETVDTIVVDWNTVLTDADYPAVPAKDGYTGVWNKVTGPITADTTIGVTYTPKAPGSSNTHVTKELFTLHCTADPDHQDQTYNWFGSHVKFVANSLIYDEERGVWTAKARIEKSGMSTILMTADRNWGNTKHYCDVTPFEMDLYWDPDAVGTNSQGTETTGLWLPEEDYVADVYCYTEPAGPSSTALEKLSAKWMWMRNCNDLKQNLKVTSTGFYLLPGTYELGEMYGNKADGFFVELTITDFAPYLEKFNAKFTDDTFVVCDEHTTETFTYVLKYTGSTTDYKQDGTGWNVDASSYSDNQSKLNGKILWVAGARTVTYTDGVEDAVIFEDQVYSTTQGSTTPAWNGEDPTREGYTFAGWSPEIAETVGGDTTYVAQWTANQYWVDFDSNGGEDLTDFYKKVTFDAPYGKLPTPVREGYDFTGWYDENGELATAESVYKFAKDTTLTAHWELKTFTVTFVADGEVVDTIVVDWNTVLSDEDYPAVPDKAGHTGVWNKVTDPITADTTIEAVYTINTYTVTFVAEGETVDTITVDWGTVLSDEQYPAVPAKEGYTGVWNKVTDPITADTTIEAVYTINTYTVTFVAEGETVDTITVDWGTVLTDEQYPAVPAKEGYTGVWNKVTDPITADTTIEAVYTINTYTVTFVAEGETVDTITVDWGTVLTDEQYPAVPDKEGYTGVWNKVTDPITADTTIEAVYTINTYTVTFVFEGETVDTITVDWGTVLSDEQYPVIAEKEGYTGAWNKVTDPITADTTIEGSYTINTYTVTFVIEGEVVETITVDWNTTLTDADYPTIPAKEGYNGVWHKVYRPIKADTTITASYERKTFTVDFVADGEVVESLIVEWGTVLTGAQCPAVPAKEGYTGAWELSEDPITANTSINAVYTINTFDVTFVADGEVVETITVDWNTILTDADYPAVPEKEGYIGVWNKVTDPITADTTIEAIYTKKTYTVTIEADGKVIDTITVEHGTVLTEKDLPAVPAKDGYTGKWVIPADGITADTTIAAEYTKVTPPVDTGDTTPAALPIVLVIAAAGLTLFMRKREEKAE